MAIRTVRFTITRIGGAARVMDPKAPATASRAAGRASAGAGLCLLSLAAGVVPAGCRTDHVATRGCETDGDCFSGEMCDPVETLCVRRAATDGGTEGEAAGDGGDAGGIADDPAGSAVDPAPWEARRPSSSRASCSSRRPTETGARPSRSVGTSFASQQGAPPRGLP